MLSVYILEVLKYEKLSDENNLLTLLTCIGSTAKTIWAKEYNFDCCFVFLKIMLLK